jgi:tetratricopeptide (TPR) repeat protein
MDWVRFQNATALRDSGRAEDAAREFRLLETEVNETDEKAALMLNEHRCYCDLGRLDEASLILNQIRKLAPRDPEVCLIVDFGEACMNIQMGHLERGLKEFDEILHRYADLLEGSQRHLSESIQRRRGVALCNAGRHAEALPLLKKSSTVSGLSGEDGQEVHLFLGTCYDRLGQTAMAKEEYLKAINFGIKTALEAHARYRVAILYFNTGAFAQAKHHLEAILQAYPEPGNADIPRKYVSELLQRTRRYLDNADKGRKD